MSSYASANLGTKFPSGARGAQALSVALIGPDGEQRNAMISALSEDGRANVSQFESYPSHPDELRWLLAQPFDVIVLDLDCDPEAALTLVEGIKAHDAAKVMVYSRQADTKLAVRFMRAGAGEYLLLPLEPGIVTEALDQAAIGIRERANPARQTSGNLFVCLCAKGGSGVTTVACNLAIALARESDQSTLLIDLALPIGDAALALGITTKYSTEDALRNVDRLDANLLKELLVRHKSGLYVLAAPNQVPGLEGYADAIDKLIALARNEFDHVIVDLGSRMDLSRTALFKQATTIYLVTLTGVSELRNSNYLISQFFGMGGPPLELVVNRFESRLLGGVNENAVTKALGRPVRWKIPDDRDAAREMQFGETGIAETRISQLSQEMASAITGRTVPPEKKKAFSLRSLGKSKAEELPDSDESLGITILPPVQPVIARATPTATPTITWSNPEPIPYGQALSAAQLSATASVAGVFEYTPGLGKVLPAGTHTLSVTFTAEDQDEYLPAQATVSLNVAKGTPQIEWPNPDAIAYGTSLGRGQLCASAPVPGTFDYFPALGASLAAGSHRLTVEFTPTDCENYVPVQASVPLKVTKAMPNFEWLAPRPILFGTPLGLKQLCATASVSGKFEYSPAPGALLPVGTHELSVTFTPADSTNYSAAHATLSLRVEKATPIIEWPSPNPAVFGTPLGSTELCATASVPGKFEYSPALGVVLAAGSHTLSVTFTPDDSENYSAAQTTVPFNVWTKATPEIAWPKPHPIAYGTRISGKQLCATASVPGTFDYSTAPGAVLAAGTHTLSVAFTPTDSERCARAEATVSLEVAKATPTIDWQTPTPIMDGTPVSSTQLCATASTPGTFQYTPAPGVELSPGSHTLAVAFTPEDRANYNTARATVTLKVVAKTIPAIAWPEPKPIPYGTALSSAQLCATASVPGTFDYSPEPGEGLAAGKHTLSVTFTPADSANYTTARATVSLSVERATPVIDWPTPKPIKSGTALGDEQLDAASWVPGTFVYSPAAGEVLPPGTHTLSVTLTPDQGANYAKARTTVTLTVVAKTMPVITWPNPDPIPSGTRLSSKQLCATASVPGIFDYSPELGEVLPAGRHTLSVSFIPADTENHRATQATVVLQVEGPAAAALLTVASAPKETLEPVGKPFGVSPKPEPKTAANVEAAPSIGPRIVHPTRPQPAPSITAVVPEQEETKVNKKWLIIAAAGVCIVLLSLMLLFHHGSKVTTKPADQPQLSTTEIPAQSDSAGLPQPTQPAKAKPSAATAEQDPTSADPTPDPDAAKPTPVQAEMMNDQLNTPSRIPRGIQNQTPTAAAPPAGISTAGLGGSGTMGTVFKGQAPEIVMGAPAGRLVISSQIAAGLLIHKTLPIYPAIAKQARVSGTVVIEASISKDGSIQNQHVVSGPVMLRQAAIDAVRTWRYKPYMLNNQPIETQTTISVIFALGE